MAQVLSGFMQDIIVDEFHQPRHDIAATGNMLWVAALCKKKTLKSTDTAHAILGKMFNESSNEKNVEQWCKLIEALKNTVDTNEYFPTLTAMKTKFSARIRYKIMDLEDLKKRKWAPRR